MNSREYKIVMKFKEENPHVCVYCNKVIEEKKHRYKKGEKVYHKSLKKYALYEETDPSNYDKAYVLLLNDNGTSERKRVTIDLLKRENEV